MVLVSFSVFGNDLVPYQVDPANNVTFPLSAAAQSMSAGTVAASVTIDSTGNFRLTNTYATFAGVYPHGLWGTNGDFWTHNFRGDFSFMDTNAIGRSNNATAVIAEMYSTATSAVFKVISRSSTNRLDIPTNPAVNPMWNGVAWPASGGGSSVVTNLSPIQSTNFGLVNFFQNTNIGVGAGTKLTNNFLDAAIVQTATSTGVAGTGVGSYSNNIIKIPSLIQTYSTNTTLASATSLVINFSPGFEVGDTNYTVSSPNDLVGATVTARSTNNFTLGFTAATLTSQTIEGAVFHQ
jgi:hypothetical protein